MKRIVLALTALVLVVPFTGCGQSGPLYIPGNPSKVRQPPPQAESTAEEEGEEDGKAEDGG